MLQDEGDEVVRSDEMTELIDQGNAASIPVDGNPHVSALLCHRTPAVSYPRPDGSREQVPKCVGSSIVYLRHRATAASQQVRQQTPRRSAKGVNDNPKRAGSDRRPIHLLHECADIRRDEVNGLCRPHPLVGTTGDVAVNLKREVSRDGTAIWATQQKASVVT